MGLRAGSSVSSSSGLRWSWNEPGTSDHRFRPCRLSKPSEKMSRVSREYHHSFQTSPPNEPRTSSYLVQSNKRLQLPKTLILPSPNTSKLAPSWGDNLSPQLNLMATSRTSRL